MRCFTILCAVSLMVIFDLVSGHRPSYRPDFQLRTDASGKLVKVKRVTPFGSKKAGRSGGRGSLVNYSGIPYEAIRRLGVYDEATISQAKERLMQMNSKEDQKRLETLLYSTDMFAAQIRRAKEELAKYPALNRKMVKYLIRMRVTDQLALMEEKFGQEIVERFMVRAILDKERRTKNASN